ncbi:MAG: LptE family protein [Candidatus Eiseniibacteriota bacterium]
MRGHPRALGAALAAAAVAAVSCAYTTSTALLPSHLKTVAVPVFENATTEYTLEQEVTDAVIARFVADNHLKVVDERSANAVVKGRITAYRNAVFGFSQAAQAQEYRVTLAASVTFKDQVKNRELWSEADMVKTANYYVVNTPGDSAKTELDGRKRAIDKLAEEIVARSVEGW